MREIMTLVTGVQPTSASIDPETAVALGAAILCSIMDNQMVDMQARIPRYPKCAGEWTRSTSFVSQVLFVTDVFCLVLLLRLHIALAIKWKGPLPVPKCLD